MLDALYSTMFRPTSDRAFAAQLALPIGLLVIVILTLNAAGALGVGAFGVILLTMTFLFAGLLGWYWFSASINLISQWLGGAGNGRSTALAIAQGLFPLIFTGPAIAAMNWSEALGAIFSLLIFVSLLVTLVIAIRRAHHFHWWKAIAALVITLTLSAFALFGLVLWPLMLALGT
ncbi:MAG: Yip1 family protein [Elainellaceae cyanobacterium]